MGACPSYPVLCARPRRKTLELGQGTRASNGCWLFPGPGHKTSGSYKPTMNASPGVSPYQSTSPGWPSTLLWSWYLTLTLPCRRGSTRAAPSSHHVLSGHARPRASRVSPTPLHLMCGQLSPSCFPMASHTYSTMNRLTAGLTSRAPVLW